jgi:hypothetical protein
MSQQQQQASLFKKKARIQLAKNAGSQAQVLTPRAHLTPPHLTLSFWLLTLEYKAASSDQSRVRNFSKLLVTSSQPAF